MHNPITAQINQSSIDEFGITPDEARTMLSILRKHDGSTLTPGLDVRGRKEVSL